MAVNYASKYAQTVDDRFAIAAQSGSVVNNNFDWIGVETVNVFSIPVVELNDYARTGANRYGTPDELGNDVQEMKITQDKSFTFTIDRASYDDTQMTMEAGARLARQINEVVIPAVDKYRFAAIVAGAKVANIKTLATTKSNAFEEFLAIQELLDNGLAPQGGRICICSPAYHNKIKLDEAFTKVGDMATKMSINGLIGEIDGVPTIKVPASYLPENVDFIITNPLCTPSPVKLQEYKIHTDAPGISGWLVEGRVRYDAFVLNEKKNAIGVHKSA